MTDKQLIIGELKREGANTRIMLGRLQDSHLPWKPHERSYSAGTLAQHISNIPLWMQFILSSDGLDLAVPQGKLEPLQKAEELMMFFDKMLSETVDALEKADEATFEGLWHLRKGDLTIVNAPRKIVMRYFVLNHIVHHRGQLSVYLRLMNIPVPGMYGPSADENG
jgi:uncharacterized damage-inducible protein DinB